MRKGLKLVFGAVLLAGSLGGALWPTAARAVGVCPNQCCDPSCFSVRLCHPAGGSCICTANCVVQPQG